MINPQIANPQTSTNTAHLCLRIVLKLLFKVIFLNFVWIWIIFFCVRQEKKYISANRTNYKSTNQKKIVFAKRKSVKCQIFGRSANLNYYILSPQICGFVICGTYLRTVHICKMHCICSTRFHYVKLSGVFDFISKNTVFK